MKKLQKIVLFVVLAAFLASSAIVLTACFEPDNRPALTGVTLKAGEAVYPASGSNNYTAWFDGYEKWIEATGCPEGAVVTYSYNGHDAEYAVYPGTYNITVRVTATDYKPLTIFAKLEIVNNPQYWFAITPNSYEVAPGDDCDNEYYWHFNSNQVENALDFLEGPMGFEVIYYELNGQYISSKYQTGTTIYLCDLGDELVVNIFYYSGTGSIMQWYELYLSYTDMDYLWY